MSFSINTNIASLQAMNYLTTNQAFQNKTINEVTSGLRIVNSGDDAAGLAVANQFASDEAVLTQGVQNANDGLATLQTIDGGMSNISQLLNRASTLATESATGTFQGSRDVLNNEFQSVLTEIDRQAQNIGMNTGGAFNTNLSVFIGGGRDTTGNQNDAAAVAEGAVQVNLSGAAVDQQGLGLTSYQTPASTLLNGNPLLNAIIAGTTGTGTMELNFSGAGFSDAGTVTVTAQNVNNATTLDQVATDINAGITSAEQTNAGAANIQALTAAGIQASVNSAGTGIVFTSANSAFAVSDAGAGTGDVAAMAVLGTTTLGTGTEVDSGAQNVQLGVTTALNGADTQNLTFSAVGSDGSLVTTTVDLNAATNAGTTADAIAAINTQLQSLSTGNPLKNLVAVPSTTSLTPTVNFMSTGNFNVFVGPGTAGDGFQSGGSQGLIATSAQTTAGTALDLNTAADAGIAVSAVGNAVVALGNAQAAVGRGENDLTYATNLAQSQLTNEAVSESSIRDANMATEAANLTKAQILLQAGVAALAQANSAPQNILTLLKS